MLGYSSVWLHELEPPAWRVARSAYHAAGIVRAVSISADAKRLTTLTDTMAQTREMEWFGVEESFRIDSRGIAAHAFVPGGMVTCGPDGGFGEWQIGLKPQERVIAIYPDRITSLDVARDAVRNSP